ncbi:hypothetical protein GCM10011511_53960 [Puia dinghuensis]|uniref:Uncharacterized protein n=1 Tax=Puia dinghuensis TaxID=1792502 RepID=A0A8J2XU63_9BACT|nr:hypothetical protein GCM10011511_53960 [Puia dinghuensis]
MKKKKSSPKKKPPAKKKTLARKKAPAKKVAPKKKSPAKKSPVKKKAAPPKAAPPVATAPPSPIAMSRAIPASGCQCSQGQDGSWYRWVPLAGGRKRIPPAYDTQEECEANCG